MIVNHIFIYGTIFAQIITKKLVFLQSNFGI